MLKSQLKIYKILTLICLLGIGAGCRKTEKSTLDRIRLESFSGQQALKETETFIKLGPRIAGTEEARKAAEYLYQRLLDLGIPAEIDSFADQTPQGSLNFHNVLGFLQGTSSNLIVLASHYDTKSGISVDFEGANDSGSSTGLLLELGRVLHAQQPLPVNLILAFFDGEECKENYGPSDGLHGSRHFARALATDSRADNVLAVIVLDMIGDRDLSVTLPQNATPALVAKTLNAAKQENARHLFRLENKSILDDHQPFLDAGMPAIVLIDFEYGSAPGLNDYWHTPADTLDKLSAESLHLIGRVTLRLLAQTIP